MGMNNRLLRPRQSGFNPRSISGLALWLDAADGTTLYTTDAGNVTAVSAPTDISGCVGWWDASDASTLFEADTGPTLATTTVGRWANKGTLGSAADLLQATAGSRPSITAAALNGMAALSFNGTTNFLRTGSLTLTQPYQYYIVFRFNSAYSAGAPRIIDAGTQPSPGRAGEFYRQDANAVVALSGSLLAASVTAANLQAFGLYAVSFDGASSFIRYKAGDIQATATAGVNNGSRLTVGGDSNAAAASLSHISVAELVVFNAALSAADRARVEKYLANKWGISGVHATATATSDPVGAWLDKSGNGRHATQATAANRPRMQTVGMNDKRSVQFFGGNTELLSLGDLSAVFPSAGEILVAFQPLSDTSYGLYETRANSSYFRNANGLSYFGTLTVGRQAGIAVSMPSTGRHIASLQASATSNAQTVLLNGATVFTGPVVGGYTGGVSHVIGNNNNAAADTGLSGYVAEVLAFPRALSASERTQIQRYLASKWGITLAPQVSNADAQDWVNRVYANGGTVSATTASAVNTFCNAIDAAGIRDRFYRLNLFCGTSDASLNAVRTPLFRGPSLSGTQYGNAMDTNANFVASDYAETGASGGLKGNGTTKYLDTGLAQSQLALTDVHLSAGFGDITTSFAAERTFVGAYNSTQTDFSVLRAAVSSGDLQGSIATFTATGSANQASAATLMIASRASLTDFRLFINGSQNASSTASVGSVTASSRTYFVFARNNAGAANNFNDARVRVYSIGLAIDATGAAAFNSAMAAFNTAMGRS